MVDSIAAILTVSATEVALAGFAGDAPICFVDCDTACDWPDDLVLPPCPVVGLGRHAAGFSSRLDTLIEEGFDPARLEAAVRAHPLAAATLVQLLRILPDLSIRSGLVAESLAYATLQGSGEHRDWLSRRAPSRTQRSQGRVRLSRGGGAVTVVLDRAEAGNAIDRSMRDALHEAFALVNLDPTISSITLRGAGRSFCLGADLDEFGTTRDPAQAHDIRRRTLPANEAVRCADRFRVEIDGACVGAGLELAAFAAHITATRRSWFQLPELAMGILPGAGGCVSLTRRIGRRRTALMALSGRRISAAKALEWGLVDTLVD